jgi:hypothetical protein
MIIKNYFPEYEEKKFKKSIIILEKRRMLPLKAKPIFIFVFFSN